MKFWDNVAEPFYTLQRPIVYVLFLSEDIRN